MIECNIKRIYRVRHAMPIRINKHIHSGDEITYFISGNGTTEINGKTHTYRSGKFAFYKAGTPHDEFNPEPCDIIWLHFSFDIKGINLKEGVFDDRDGKLLSLLQRLRELYLEQKGNSNLLIEIYLAQAIIIAAEKQQENDAAISVDRINWEEVLNYIDTNMNKQVDFTAIAALNHYSYDRFRHLFTKHFGLSPYAYLTEQRIINAKRLLKRSDLSITAIAFDCGFSSSSQFTNIFKKHVGVSPKEYRRNI